jgi:hypothetical protein
MAAMAMHKIADADILSILAAKGSHKGYEEQIDQPFIETMEAGTTAVEVFSVVEKGFMRVIFIASVGTKIPTAFALDMSMSDYVDLPGVDADLVP